MYDLETYNEHRVVLCCGCIYNLGKISGKNHRNLTQKEYQKCLNDCVVFKGIRCFSETLDHVLSFKGEAK